jgi:CRP-like cAMP-binding protein
MRDLDSVSMTQEKTKSFKAGERIITCGDVAGRAYLILKGSVRVHLDRDGRKIILGELGVGSIFGETALFGGGTYGAHVDAASDVEVAIITPESFAGKIESSDPMVRSMVLMLIERLRKTNEALLKSETREFMDIALI